MGASSDNESSDLISRYGDEVVLAVLIEIIGGDETLFWNDNAKASAAETLFNMSCGENEETIKLMTEKPGLLDGLASVVKSETSGVDVSLYCAATLRRMAE